MQLKSRIVHFFLVLLLGFAGFVSLLLLELFQYEPPAAAVRLPQQAEWALRVDPEQMVRDEAYTLLFEAKDEQLITLLRKLANERIERHNQKGKLAIDLRQDIVVFGMRHADNQLTGLLLQVADPEQFHANIPKHLHKGQAFALSGQTALILSEVRTEQTTAEPLPATELNRLAAACLRDTRPWNQPTEKNMPFLALETTGFSGKDASIAVRFYNEGRTIRLDGSFTAEQPFEPARYSLKNKGLYVNTTIIPEGMPDSLNRLLPFIGGKLPELSAFVMDYQGMTISETNAGVFPFATLNLILTARERFPVDSLLPKGLRGNRKLEVASTTYYLKQLDENTVFIGLDTNAILRKSAATPFEIKGPLAPLTNISGNPTVMAFIDLVPQVRFGKQFIARTESVHVTVKKEQGNRYRLNGQLRFREDAYGVHEVLKLLIGIGLLD